MANHSDMGDMYARAYQRSLQQSVQEAQIQLRDAHGDIRFYMCMPRDYIVKYGLRLLLAVLLCILACHSILAVSTPPLFLIVFHKWKGYCRICSWVNISGRKLCVLLACWIAVCILLNIVFWDWLTTVL